MWLLKKILKLFFSKNIKTALGVAEARGVIISAVIKKRIPCIEVAPSEVKLAVTGDGRAPKDSVARMGTIFLGFVGEKPLDDVTDALAIAISVSNLPIEEIREET